MTKYHKAAQAYLEANPEVTEVHVTADCQVFQSKNYAELHGRSLAKGKTGVQTIDRAYFVEVTTEEDAPELLEKASDIVALLEETDDLKLIELYQQAESNRPKPRTTVMDTIAAKIEDLTKED